MIKKTKPKKTKTDIVELKNEIANIGRSISFNIDETLFHFKWGYGELLKLRRWLIIHKNRIEQALKKKRNNNLKKTKPRRR